MDIDTRLKNLDDGQAEILRRLDEMQEDIRNTVIEIGGVPEQLGRNPQRRSIRVRLHEIENDRSTAQAAAAAVAAAKELTAIAAEKRFTKREKLAALGIAVIVALPAYIALFFH